MASAEDAAGLAAMEDGDAKKAARHFARAELARKTAALLGPGGELPRPMTSEALQRRGRAIARTRAGRDKLLLAISESEWGSQEQYARRRLKISPASLQGYRDGTRRCPMWVADAVKADFGIPHGYWPGGLIDG